MDITMTVSFLMSALSGMLEKPVQALHLMQSDS